MVLLAIFLKYKIKITINYFKKLFKNYFININNKKQNNNL